MTMAAITATVAAAAMFLPGRTRRTVVAAAQPAE
jgi:hypothetical protein